MSADNYPFFSVIVCVFNVESYLERCLESLLSQSFSDLEVIIINDGSQDDSQKIIAKYQQKYNNVISLKNKANKGLAFSRNLGIKQAKGQYISFIDADDFIEKNSFNILYKYLNDNQSLDVLIFDIYKYINENLQKHHSNNINYRKNEYNALELLEETALGYFLPSPVNKIFKRSFLIENHLFFPEDIFHQDIEHAIRVAFYCRHALKIDCFLYYHVQRKTNVNFDEIYIKNYFQMLEHLKQFFIEKEFTKTNMPLIYELFFMIFSNYILKTNYNFKTPEEKRNISRLYYQYLNAQINKNDEFSDIFQQVILDMMGRTKPTLLEKKIEENPWYPILFKTRKRRLIFILRRSLKAIGFNSKQE